MKRTMELNNVLDMRKRFPATFEIPDHDELASIKPGSFVKVSNTYDRFWVEVVSVDFGGDCIKGTLANTLVGPVDGEFGDEVELRFHHVYEVRHAEEMEEAKRNAQG